jgi:hypothetical protein
MRAFLLLNLFLACSWSLAGSSVPISPHNKLMSSWQGNLGPRHSDQDDILSRYDNTPPWVYSIGFLVYIWSLIAELPEKDFTVEIMKLNSPA